MLEFLSTELQDSVLYCFKQLSLLTAAVGNSHFLATLQSLRSSLPSVIKILFEYISQFLLGGLSKILNCLRSS